MVAMAIQRSPFRELGEISQGIPTQRYKSNQGDLYQIVNVGDLESLYIKEVQNQIELNPQSVERYELRKYDVVIAIRGTLLKSSVFTEIGRKTVPNQTTAVFRPDLEKVNPLYIAVLLRSDYFEQLISFYQRQSTTTLASLRVSELRSLEIPLPALTVQQQIADLFLTMEDMEKVIQDEIKTRRNLSKLALLKAIEKQI